VPLALRAFDLWTELQVSAGVALLRQTGALMIGPATGTLVRGTLASVRAHNLPHDIIAGEDLPRRFPAFASRPGEVAVLEERAGMLAVEACIEALLQQAGQHGAELRFEDPLLDYQADAAGIRVRTASGAIACARLVLAAGPWLPDIAGEAWPGPRLMVERQAVCFFQPRAAAAVSALRCPIALWEREPELVFYTLPDAGHGVKAAVHHEGEETRVEAVDRVVADSEVAGLRALLERLMPAAAGALRETSVCLYTNTPDHDFLVDAHPAEPHVFVVSACSGHGFKFAPAIAEAVSAMVSTGRPAEALSAFRFQRFHSASSA
jgi:sarcosine oxidase